MQVANPDFFLKMVPLMDGGDDVGMVLSPQSFHNLQPHADIFNHANIQFWEYAQHGYDAIDFISSQVQQPHPTSSACSTPSYAYHIWSCAATIHIVLLVCRHAPLFFGTQLFGGLGCCLLYCVGLAGFRQLNAQAVLLTDRACCRDQLLDPFSRLSRCRLVA